MSKSEPGKIELRPIDSVRPSTYNPRTADEERLRLVELSLRKLGWLLPIFADPDGEILSGHQRHLVAGRMGMTHVPVFVTPVFDELRRKAINILFNRATNDLDRSDTSWSITEKLKAQGDLFRTSLPDKPLGDAPCLRTELVNLKPLLMANRGRWIKTARNAAKSLAAAKLWMPIVVDPDGVVVNGIGRLELLAEQELEQAEVVRVSHEEAEFARVLLNYLSMDFNIHERYADVLRHNSFRRAVGVKEHIGNAFSFELFGVPKKCDFTKQENRTKWISHYGRTVIDWGAGLLQDTNRLKAIGVDCVPFEPYVLTPGTQTIDVELTRKIVREFLARVAAGTRFDAVFQNNVMNSVPFYQDRLHIVTLISALCHAGTKVHACTMNLNTPMAFDVQPGKSGLNETSQSKTTFSLDYEPNILLADFARLPKVQKLHTTQEWRDLWLTRFENVRSVRADSEKLECTVSSLPRPIDPAALRAAIEFEFELPYPDGQRMNLSQEAKSAFSARLALDL